MCANRRGVWGIVLSVTLAGALAGVAPAGAATEPKRGGTFRMAEREAPGLDPHLTVSFLSHSYVSLICVEAAIGTGPFILRSFQRGVKIRFGRNPDYLVKGLPYLDAVEVEIAPEPATRLALMRTGKVEMAQAWGWLSPEELQTVKPSLPNVVATRIYPNNQGQIYMPTDKPPFNDVRVRRAVSLAIDRKGWIGSTHMDEGCLDSGPIPCGWVDWKVDAAKLEPAKAKYHIGYDPQAAKHLLAQAGYARGLSMPLWHWPGYAGAWRSMYELAADNLGNVGLSVELKPQEYGPYIANTFLGKYDGMAMGPTSPVVEVDEWLSGLYSPGQSSNHSLVDDATLNKLLLAQRRTLDLKERKRLVDEIQMYLPDKAYYVFFTASVSCVTYPATVKGYQYHDG